MPIAIDCLHYRENERPSSEELCQRLAGLKESREYRESVQQVERVQNDIAKLERQIGKMQVREAANSQQLRDEIQELCDEIQSKDVRHKNELDSQERYILTPVLMSFIDDVRAPHH